jgi:cell division protein FtsI (penicillin-binding protein 3)
MVRSVPHAGRRWSRERIFRLVIIGVFGLLATRLLQVQVIQRQAYAVLASDQQRVVQKLFPNRGSILVREDDGSLFPLAFNSYEDLLFVNPRVINDAAATAEALAPVLGLTATATTAMAESITASQRAYLPIQHRLTEEQRAAIQELNLPGLYLVPEPWRQYAEGSTSGNLLGFLGYAQDGETRVGRYGVEQYWEEQLAGSGGYVSGLRAAGGGIIAGATEVFRPAIDGSDLVLTINRSLQFAACRSLEQAVQKHQAAGGTVVVLEPKTGAVLALCSSPTFDPNNYGAVESVAQYESRALVPYEVGSVMKPIVMASAIDAGVVTPQTTFEDPGEERIGGYTIKNAQNKRWGKQTMIGVLERSINTGMVFVARQLKPNNLRRYLTAFGFGQPTSIDITGDRSGNTASLDKPGEIYAATASFGQGITATPLQLAAAYAAIANGGTLVQPYVVAEVVAPDGTRTVTEPKVVRQVLQPATAAAVRAMLASVVHNAPILNAQVPGFIVGGKTGTAQIPDPRGGYLVDQANHTVAGMAPANDPVVVTIAKLETPKVAWAEGSAAPLFRDVTAAALRILRIQPNTP